MQQLGFPMGASQPGLLICRHGFPVQAAVLLLGVGPAKKCMSRPPVLYPMPVARRLGQRSEPNADDAARSVEILTKLELRTLLDGEATEVEQHQPKHNLAVGRHSV